MLAILVKKATEYVCISVSKGNKNACNLFQRGTNMLAIIENLISRDSFRNNSHVTIGTFSTLQAYFVPFERASKHILSVLDMNLIITSPLLSTLQAY